MYKEGKVSYLLHAGWGLDLYFWFMRNLLKFELCMASLELAPHYASGM